MMPFPASRMNPPHNIAGLTRSIRVEIERHILLSARRCNGSENYDSTRNMSAAKYGLWR
jgi:hypothetical protein